MPPSEPKKPSKPKKPLTPTQKAYRDWEKMSGSKPKTEQEKNAAIEWHMRGGKPHPFLTQKPTRRVR